MADKKFPFVLMPGEEPLLKARPHFLAMFGLTVFWFLMAVLGVVYITTYPALMDLLQSKVKMEFLVKHAYDVIWFASILIPLLVMAIFRINFGYVLTLLVISIAHIILRWKVEPLLKLDEGLHAHLENLLLIAVGFIGMVGCEFFRRGHRYYLTTQRLVARFGMMKISERSVLYSKIDDVILQKNFLGSLFNFGTVIPLTSTGLGMGQDMAIAGAGVGAGTGSIGAGLFAAGGKGQNVPRELSFYVLYRIKKPEEARNIILREMQARERPRNMQNV